MKRLTDKYWRNFDPWECCGQDNFCQRGCHDPGGCANGCIVPRLYARLAAYEDTGLTTEEVSDLALQVKTLETIEAMYDGLGNPEHLRELVRAEKDGRLVVLPCGENVELERDGYTFKADHWNHSLSAFRDAPETNSGKQVALFSIAEVTVALAGKGGAKADKDV